MKIAPLCRLFALVALSCSAQAQTPDPSELAFRFTGGRSTLEVLRIAGDLSLIRAEGSARVELDVAGLQKRQVLEVTSDGAALCEVRPLATTIRLTLPDRKIVTKQNSDGFSVSVNGVDTTPPRKAFEATRATVDRTGEVSIHPDGEQAIAFVLAHALAGAILPGREVAVGEGWSSEASTVAGNISLGDTSIAVPALSLRARSVLRSFETEGGRRIAIISTSNEGAAAVGSGRLSGTFTSRFDMSRGDLIDTEGSTSIDLVVPDAERRDAASSTRLTGHLRLKIGFLAAEEDEHPTGATTGDDAALPVTDSQTTRPLTRETTETRTSPTEPLRPTSSSPPVADTVAPPQPTTPLAAGFGRLGAQQADRSLSGGEILRYFADPSPRDCRSSCEQDPNCRGYTWVKPGGYRAGDPAMCYLMRSYASADRHTCCVAATDEALPSDATTPPPHPTAAMGATRSRKICWSGGATQFYRAIHYCVGSVLPPQGGRSYGPENLGGWSNGSKAWCEGAWGHGVGQMIDIRIEGGVPFRRLLVANGYGRSAETFRNNGRVKVLEVVSADGMQGRITLPDSVDLQPIVLPGPARDWIGLKIVDVYPGARFRDTCLSFVAPDFEYEEELLLQRQGLLPKTYP